MKRSAYCCAFVVKLICFSSLFGEAVKMGVGGSDNQEKDTIGVVSMRQQVGATEVGVAYVDIVSHLSVTCFLFVVYKK